MGTGLNDYGVGSSRVLSEITQDAGARIRVFLSGSSGPENSPQWTLPSLLLSHTWGSPSTATFFPASWDSFLGEQERLKPDGHRHRDSGAAPNVSTVLCSGVWVWDPPAEIHLGTWAVCLRVTYVLVHECL